ncbi:MAG: ABC transporter ATP-binding protein [Lentimicrobiaceae bacterium]|jgi:ABC-2 type transport system ATP-binding protein|nr:ABC transporter ATP-binding protein [Lentimicrobiaceae bacterium]MCP4909258.1 ABC transporter ATP-binding protein [Bacteroidota bacterium]MBT3454219.1 ABC transporter ATP-binding protein [Lentimicrobiaceae bacterium]MBT3819244.1 ABC transporter ATP-binding protein [Lentimicrobiaceae bacterium]MBT4060379.1 ABC transporter ATP-binding protein [Lentimicrobiaceae bacterium]
MDNKYTLQALNVSKNYANHKALDNVSIEVPAQSIFGLLGPNGAGKTTLIRIINLISIMDQGKVMLNGNPINTKDIANIGYLPEERGLYKKMKVGEQAVYLAQLKGMSRRDAIKQLKYWFEKFEISSWWNKKVEELSKGMAQKVQFIVTVLHKPDLLIFDEPFSGFDPINVNILKEEILNLRDDGATIIFSTHNMASVEELCDNIALINNSKTVLSGEINEVKEKFKDNLFEIAYKSKSDISLSPGNYTLKETKRERNIHYANVKINNGKVPNDLIKEIINQAEIVSFREILPSINDIFIQQVSSNQS